MGTLALYSRRYAAYLIDLAVICVLTWLLSAILIKAFASYLPADRTCNVNERRGVHEYQSAQAMAAASEWAWHCMVVAAEKAPPAVPADVRYLDNYASPALPWLPIIRAALGVIIAWSYFAFFESSRFEATCGKTMLGLKVTGKLGERITRRRASARFLIICIFLCGAYLATSAILEVIERQGDWYQHLVNVDLAAMIVLLAPCAGLILGGINARAVPIHDRVTRTIIAPRRDSDSKR